MKKVTSYFLLVFLLITHSAIAMDVHLPDVSDHQHESALEHSHDEHVSSSDEYDSHTSGLLDGHCSHSSAHTSALVYSLQITTLDISSVYYPAANYTAYIHTQAPPVRPPKANI